VSDVAARTEAAKRLLRARRDAGFRTASDAIRRFGWTGSTYRAHENGQNSYKGEAVTYAKAYRTTAGFLLYGEQTPVSQPGRPESDGGLDPQAAERVFAAVIRNLKPELDDQSAAHLAQAAIMRTQRQPDPRDEETSQLQAQVLAIAAKFFLKLAQ
jgi:hypothetical protein